MAAVMKPCIVVFSGRLVSSPESCVVVFSGSLLSVISFSIGTRIIGLTTTEFITVLCALRYVNFSHCSFSTADMRDLGKFNNKFQTLSSALISEPPLRPYIILSVTSIIFIFILRSFSLRRKEFNNSAI